VSALDLHPSLAREVPAYHAFVKILARAEERNQWGMHRTFEQFLDASLLAYDQWRESARAFAPITTMEEYAQVKRLSDFVPVWLKGSPLLEEMRDETRLLLREAWVIYRDHSLEDFQDILGPAYEALGHKNRYMGQYFTPWPLAKMMAQMLVSETDWTDTGRYTAQRPCTVLEPCVGAGVMLLAMADSIPINALLEGRVAFYGMDLDPLCVKMARLNLESRGLTHHAPRMTTLDDMPDDVLLDAAPGLLAQGARITARLEHAAPEQQEVMRASLERAEERLGQLGFSFEGEEAPFLPTTTKRKRRP
jgi:type I restriction-modification system DNA methylase subunit